MSQKQNITDVRALDGARPRVALMTSIHATRSDIPGAAPWKRRSECLLRAGGLPSDRGTSG
ncbi:hypothetical protein ABZ725_05530 [Streptomyces sp. NPDC006872]|uniref:hypothetical protein n=1 Tax=Streptomyces sp. NPDC006872 TaxID=3155720 RepID=UPI0033C656EA